MEEECEAGLDTRYANHPLTWSTSPSLRTLKEHWREAAQEQLEARHGSEDTKNGTTWTEIESTACPLEKCRKWPMLMMSKGHKSWLIQSKNNTIFDEQYQNVDPTFISYTKLTTFNYSYNITKAIHYHHISSSFFNESFILTHLLWIPYKQNWFHFYLRIQKQNLHLYRP